MRVLKTKISYSFFLLMILNCFFQNLYAENQFNKGVVVSAHPLATKAGRMILERGGTAVDAAVTIQAVLGLVEPQSSGMGGGGFLLHYSKGKNKVTSFDGRERAPLKMSPKVFEKFKGSRSGFYDAVTSTISIGVPGIPAMLGKAHKKFGLLSWQSLLDFPIQLAKNGFNITPRFYALVQKDVFLSKHAQARKYFYTDKLNSNKVFLAKPIGTNLKNIPYASTLKKIALKGPAGFYSGVIPKQIIRNLNEINKNSLLTEKDFLKYTSKERIPVCGYYRSYKICSMGPPSSGGLALLQIFGILQKYDSNLMKDDVKKIHLVTEATRLAMADRSKYLGDPDFVEVPIKKLLNANYLKSRAKLIKLKSTISKVKPGQLNTLNKLGLNVDNSSSSTTHFVILDKFGNAVSMTSSVESAFGSRIMSAGMMLNNQLTDFSFSTKNKDGLPIFNSVAPGKRPMSSMTPTIIFDQKGNLFALIGSPGGKSIIGYVTQTIIGLIDLGYTIQKSISSPRFIVRGKDIVLEKNTFLVNYEKELKQLGHSIKIRNHYSGLHGIKLTKTSSGNLIDGGADPRREGTIEFTAF